MFPADAETAVFVLLQSSLIFWLSGLSVSRLLDFDAFDSGFSWTSLLGIPVFCGLMLRYCAELVTGNSLFADAFCLVVACYGVFCLIKLAKKVSAKKRRFLAPGMWFLLIWLPLAWLSIASPIYLGDAKVIWFFHSKIIFSAGGINAGAGFDDPAIAFSHPDYPKFVATIGAAIAHTAGFWNGYLPKYAVALVIIPLVAFFADIMARKRLSEAAVFLVAGVSGAGSTLYNGYMDGLLGMWLVALISALWEIGQATKLKNEASRNRILCLLVFSGTALVMLPNLKVEGLLLAGIFAGLTLWVFAPLQKFFFGNGGVLSGSRRWRLLPVPALGLLAFFMWRLDCVRWGLVNDMTSSLGGAWARVVSRITDREQLLLCKDYFDAYYATIWLLALVWLACLARWRSSHREICSRVIVACCAGSTIYAAFMLLVYLCTYHDLQWHLQYSSLRTLLPAQNALVAAVTFLALDNPKAAAI